MRHISRYFLIIVLIVGFLALASQIYSTADTSEVEDFHRCIEPEYNSLTLDYGTGVCSGGPGPC